MLEASAQRFARAVARTPDERLLRIMTSPARRPILRTIFAMMPARFDPSPAPRTRGIIEFRIARRDGRAPERWQLAVSDRGASTSRGGDAEPSVVLELGPVEFLQLVTGATTAPDLYTRGRLGIDGNLMTAVVISALFRMPGQ